MDTHLRNAAANRLAVSEIATGSLLHPAQYPGSCNRVFEALKPLSKDGRLDKDIHDYLYPQGYK
jgi:hypothetical protein